MLRGEPVHVAEGVVVADYSQVELHVDAPGGFPAGPGTGLTMDPDDTCTPLTVARHDGHVPVRLEVHDQEPALDPAWDAVAEMPLRGGGQVRVTGWAGTGTVEGPVLPAVDLRARYAVRDGQQGSEQFRRPPWDAAPVERYVVQLWPAPPAPARVVAASTPWSQYWAFGPAAEEAVRRLRDVPDPGRLDAVVDAALDAHPDTLAHLLAGDARYRVGIVRYAQELFRVTYATRAYEDLQQDTAELERRIDARVATRRA